MRIMHIQTRLIVGGANENTLLSCEGQAAAGNDVALAYGPTHGPEGSMLDRAEGNPGIETFEIPHLVRQISPLSDVRALGELRALIRGWKPDVVHTHSSKAGVLGRRAAWREGVPRVVHTIHGLPFHRYQPRSRRAVYVMAERMAARWCHRIVCVADAMRVQALEAGVGTRGQYVTVYSGMDLDAYLTPQTDRDEVRSRLGFAEDDFVCVTVARLAPHKGHDDLLDGLGPLLRRLPSVKLLWVGDGWAREHLETRIAGMGLRESVRLVGLVPPEDVPQYLQAADLVVHPSYWEGLPRAITQGLLSERPAVAYDVDGTGEVCVDGETGLLVAPGDLEGLADAVRWMIDHPRRRREMAVRGRALCRERFSAQMMVEALDTVYEVG